VGRICGGVDPAGGRAASRIGHVLIGQAGEAVTQLVQTHLHGRGVRGRIDGPVAAAPTVTRGIDHDDGGVGRGRPQLRRDDVQYARAAASRVVVETAIRTAAAGVPGRVEPGSHRRVPGYPAVALVRSAFGRVGIHERVGDEWIVFQDVY